jgi:hypothetical protein
MRLHEFVSLTEEASVCSTTAGSIAPVSMPIGGMISRNSDNFFSGTVSSDPFPNTPYKKKKKKKTTLSH